MLTRTDTGMSSLGITFFEWKKKIKNKVYLDSLDQQSSYFGKRSAVT